MKPGAARIFPVKNHLTLLLSISSQCWLIKKKLAIFSKKHWSVSASRFHASVYQDDAGRTDENITGRAWNHRKDFNSGFFVNRPYMGSTPNLFRIRFRNREDIWEIKKKIWISSVWDNADLMSSVLRRHFWLNSMVKGREYALREAHAKLSVVINCSRFYLSAVALSRIAIMQS